MELDGTGKTPGKIIKQRISDVPSLRQAFTIFTFVLDEILSLRDFNTETLSQSRGEPSQTRSNLLDDPFLKV